MRLRLDRLFISLVPTLALVGGAVAEPLAGRWQGAADLSGVALPMVLDLERDASGQWIGSVILPGRGVKGAPLRQLAVTERSLKADLGAAFPGPGSGSTSATLQLQADGTLAGHWQQGGLTAPLVLRHDGAAQVDRPLQSSAISRALEGTWLGRYELGGYPRDVTLTLANGPSGSANGALRIVGQRTTALVVDLVLQNAQFVSLTASAADFRIEGRWSEAEQTIVGAMAQGPFEAPLVLRRSGARTEKQP